MQPLLEATRLRELMPQTSAFLRAAAAAFESACPWVVPVVQASVALRRAVAADDFALVSAIYRDCKRQGISPMHATEGDYELGVSEQEVRAFAERHRAARRAQQNKVGEDEAADTHR